MREGGRQVKEGGREGGREAGEGGREGRKEVNRGRHITHLALAVYPGALIYFPFLMCLGTRLTCP